MASSPVADLSAGSRLFFPCFLPGGSSFLGLVIINRVFPTRRYCKVENNRHRFYIDCTRLNCDRCQFVMNNLPSLQRAVVVASKNDPTCATCQVTRSMTVDNLASTALGLRLTSKSNSYSSSSPPMTNMCTLTSSNHCASIISPRNGRCNYTKFVNRGIVKCIWRYSISVFCRSFESKRLEISPRIHPLGIFFSSLLRAFSVAGCYQAPVVTFGAPSGPFSCSKYILYFQPSSESLLLHGRTETRLLTFLICHGCVLPWITMDDSTRTCSSWKNIGTDATKLSPWNACID